MIREICKDETFLAQKAAPATAADLGVAQDLMETLTAHKDGCVGMAANMIGVNKRIIAFENDGEYMVMFNPVIVKQSGAYETDEGCLSLTGTRKTKRHKVIKVQWQNEKFQTRLKTFTGWTAEIIQHEIDHCEGIFDLTFFFFLHLAFVQQVQWFQTSFQCASMAARFSCSPITMITSCALAMGFKVMASRLAFSSSQPFPSEVKPLMRIMRPQEASANSSFTTSFSRGRGK